MADQEPQALFDTAVPERSRNRARPAKGTKPAETVGGVLERRVGRIEFAEGALSRLRVPVTAEGGEPGRDVLSDIDILSIDVDARLRLSLSSLECKSAPGQRGEPQTLVWLAGFRQLMNLDRVVFVRPTISTRGRALARRLNISILDEATLSQRELAHRWVPERFAHLDGAACAHAEGRTDTQLKGLSEVPSALATFLRNEALLASSHASLAAVEALGTAFEKQGVLPEPAATVLASHALMALVAAAIRDAGSLDDLGMRALRTRLQRALTTGDPDDDYLMALLERADAVVNHVVTRTHRAYVDAGAEPLAVAVPSLRDAVATVPGYLEDYLDFVERLRANPAVSRSLLQSVELACFEALVGGPAWMEPAFAHLFTVEHRGLLLVAVRCLRSVAGDQVVNGVKDIALLTHPRVTDIAPDRREPNSQ
ncbi:hypothetical protein [Modestobacter sp. Leaf380]|uniref:hypothetical protein n=1 Tax=Modestobacter sp. Leaf380 TaxID=1736356 RepID=UPI000A812A38|nr:hypothetical protein [Modestobacter sp. Leaf380]